MASPASTSSDNASFRRKSRVSAEHTLNRVRENQRRHRARQKDHVASLEQKLAETEQLLAEAKLEIATLKAEQAAANAMCQLNQLRSLETSSFSNETTITTMNEKPDLDKHAALGSIQSKEPLEYPEVPDFPFLGDAMSHLIFNITDVPSLPLPTVDSDMQRSGPPPCCSDTPSSPPPEDETPDPECSTCKTRPPPDPSESTTLCAQAFVMISQQNFRNLDPETIRLWLAQGLRRAQREGEGCRVENGALLRLLDYISGM